MQWLNTLSPWQWVILAAIPPAIVALYFLKLRRVAVTVPSTLLWQRALEDLHVNSLWQKLRQNLLLYLQLAVIALLILALLRPGWMSQSLPGTYLIFMLDTSASMQTIDEEISGEPVSRLTAAKRQITEAIGRMQSNQQAMIISFSDVARIEQGLTHDRNLLLSALQQVQPTSRSTSIDEALRVASSVLESGIGAEAQNIDQTTLYLVSDGSFPPGGRNDLGQLRPVFWPVGKSSTTNIGITTLSVRPHESQTDQLQVFGRVENYHPTTKSVQVELYANDQLIDAAKLTVPGQSSAGTVFNIANMTSGVLRLQLSEDDEYMVDNLAWAVINSPDRGQVLLVTDNPDSPLAQVLRTRAAQELAEISVAPPEALQTAAHRQAAAAGDYRLIVYDNCQPDEMPAANTLFLNATPPSDWQVGPVQTGVQIIRTARAHPLMQYVEMDDVAIYQANPLLAPVAGSTLLESSQGSILAIAPRGTYEDVVIGFGLTVVDDQGTRLINTNWPIRQSFPVFLLNSLTYLTGVRQNQFEQSIHPGEPILVRSASSSDSSLLVLSPNGQKHPISTNSPNRFSFTKTEELGIYEVSAQDSVEQRFAVNLFDSFESDVAARVDTIRVGENTVSSEPATRAARSELWKWLLLLGLGVLLLEWYIYNRRVYV